MSDLLEELTAPLPQSAYPRVKGTIDRLLQDELEPDAADAVRKALLSHVPSPVLSKRLRARGWEVSAEMIRKYRMREEQ